MSAPLVLAAILAVAIPWQLYRAHRFDTRIVDRWASDHGVDLTDENRPVIARYLRRARLLRTWGGVAGAVVPSLADLILNGRFQVLGFGGDGESAPLGFGTIFVGYLLGALCAEVSLVRPMPEALRAASLVPRELSAYLPRGVLVAQRAATGFAVLATAVIAVVPYGEAVTTPGPMALIAFAAGVLALGAGLEAVERWLVRRPQPFTSPPMVAADDAIRAQSIRSVAGAGLALLLLYDCGVSLALQASESRVLHATMLVPAVGFFLACLVACQDVAGSRWRVRRPARAGAAVSA
jgi:hypothetical protein